MSRSAEFVNQPDLIPQLYEDHYAAILQILEKTGNEFVVFNMTSETERGHDFQETGNPIT